MNSSTVHSTVPEAASASIALRLRLAFGAVAATTLVASVAAILAFSSVTGTFNTVSTHSFPATVAAAHLRVNSQELTTALAALAEAENPTAKRAAHERLPIQGWINYTFTGEESGRKLDNDRLEILGMVTF